MKKWLIGSIIASVAGGALAQAKAPVKCTGEEPFKYRVAFSYIGGSKSKHEAGHGVGIMCLAREIKTEADWDWLQKKIEVRPQVTKITIMGAAPLTGP